ncbi:SHOCT domain-containing protein [Streptomyces tritici]|uniref:SHOCT domain-containing protein n=1 Tax=Streptomyces tritici TaxID=2054410 RepID=UPI003AF0AFDD
MGSDHRRRRPAPADTEPSHRAHSPPCCASPEQQLAERFARGDIDEEDYRRRLDALHGSGPPTKH